VALKAVKVERLTTSDGRLVCETCLIADRPFARMRGLLGRRSLRSGEGLLLRPAASVHTFFMRFAIDVVFLDRDLNVLSIARDLRPWRAAGRRGAHAALELPAGECARRGVEPGDRLVVGDSPAARGMSDHSVGRAQPPGLAPIP
jgi:uncharacterized membrane protein (UPF0127 family)